MDVWSLTLVAVGLSMDAFAVSVSNALCMGRLRTRQLVATALSFGFFQALMPWLGFHTGRLFSTAVARFDGLIAFVLLGAIGAKMLRESLRSYHAGETCEKSRFTAQGLLMQAVATSIDALAAGVSFAVLQVGIISTVTYIGVVTFAFSLAGGFLGRRFHRFLGIGAEVAGGVMLILIGLRFLLEDLF